MTKLPALCQLLFKPIGTFGRELKLNDDLPVSVENTVTHLMVDA